MAFDTALGGLRVLDLTDETGRLAGKILAQLGADVVRLRGGAHGPPMRSVPGGLLDWWFDAGTDRVDLGADLRDLRRLRGLDGAAGEAARAAFLALVARADVLIETTAPGELAACGLDAADLRGVNPSLVHVSLTPFGRGGPRAAWRTSDLVTGALGGLLSVCGTPDQPLNGWGRQWFAIGGFYAAIAALAGVRAVRLGAPGMHFDLSLQHCATSCSEQLLMYWLFMGAVPGRHGALHWTGLYDVIRCRDGHVMMTPAPTGDNLTEWLIEDGAAGTLAESPPRALHEWMARAQESMAVVRDWAATRPSEALFHEGQRRNLSFGLVRSVAQCAACPQHEARGFLRPIAGSAIRSPGLPFRMSASAEATGAPPRAVASRPEEVLDRWGRASVMASSAPPPGAAVSPLAGDPSATGDPPGAPAPPRDRPLEGIRILDFTWVLAGPKATRIFADLGADVIKLQTEVRAQGANHNEFPFFLLWNRNKRSACLDMKVDGAIEVFRKLVEQSDVVIDNFAPGVLERWGVGWETLRAWNPRLIYVAMSGCGEGGPWRDFVTFAPTIQALSGLTYLTNPPGRGDVGFGVSINDHVSGLFGAVAALAALEARSRTGEGQLVDLSQLEVGSYLVGPALVDLMANGREAQAIGNADPFDAWVPNEVYRCADGEWLAVTAHDDDEWRRLCGAIGATEAGDEVRFATAEARSRHRASVDALVAAWAAGVSAREAMLRLQAAEVAAGLVQTARHLTDEDEQLAARFWLAEVEHATLGRQRHERFPAWLDGEPVEMRAAPPILGQHTFDVYRDLLGMSDEEIALGIGQALFA